MISSQSKDEVTVGEMSALGSDQNLSVKSQRGIYDKEPPVPSKYFSKLPAYVNLSQDLLIEYLSSLNFVPKGNFAVAYQMFLIIVKRKKEVLSWSEINTPKISSLFESETDLIKALKYVEEFQLLYLRHKIKNQEMTPHYVRFCEPDTISFYSEKITDLLLENFVNNNANLTTSRELRRKKVDFPDKMAILFDSGVNFEFSPNIDDNDMRIFYVEMYSDTFYFTSLSTPYLLDILMLKLKNSFSYSGHDIIAQINKVVNLEKPDIERIFKEADYNKLFMIAERIYNVVIDSHTSHPITNFHDFIDCISIFYFILPKKIEYQEKIEKINFDIEEFTNTIMDSMVRQSSYPRFDFEELLMITLQGIYQDNEEVIFEQKIKFMKEHIVNVKEVQNLSSEIIIDFQEYYIFAPHIQSILSQQYQPIRLAVTEYLKKELKDMLRGRVSFRNSIFFNSFKTDVAIRQFLFKNYPVYYTICNHSKIVWQALYSGSSTENLEEINKTKLLALFFNIQSRRMLTWIEILNIHLRNMYLNVSKSLNFFQKIMLFIRQSGFKFLAQLEEIESSNANMNKS